MDAQKKYLVIQNGKLIKQTEQRSRILTDILNGKITGTVAVYQRVYQGVGMVYAYEALCTYTGVSFSFKQTVGG